MGKLRWPYLRADEVEFVRVAMGGEPREKVGAVLEKAREEMLRREFEWDGLAGWRFDRGDGCDKPGA